MSKKTPSASPAPASSRNLYVIIALFGFLMYANTFKHGFVLDDVAVIENNKFVTKGVKGIPDILTTFYWEGYWNSNAGLYRPLSLISFALEYELSPANPLLPHVFNVIYYALACCLLFEFLCTVFNKVNRYFFFFVVLLFIVHPIHTEVVANIKSRDEIFSLLFFLLCCRQLYKAKGSPVKKTILASLFFLLALLSKEGAIAFLPLIFFIDYLKEKKILLLIKQRTTLLLTSVVWFAWHSYIINSSMAPRLVYTYSDNSLLSSASLLEQKATAFGIFARYMVKCFVPYQLSYDYSFNQIPIIHFTSLLAIAGLALFAGLIYVAVKFFKRDPLITFSIATIVLPLLLTGNLFFNIGATMADRFLFIPTIGSCILICLLLFKLFKSDPLQVMFNTSIRYALIVVMILFSVRTYTRNKDWKDNFTLFKADVLTVPNSARVHYNNALVLQKTFETDPGRSIKEYEVCLGIDPFYQDAILNLGAAYTKQNNFVPAINVYRRVLSVNPNNADVLGNMGYTFYKSKQLDSAVTYLKKAHLAGNISVGTYNALGTTYFEKQAYPEALQAFEEGIQKDSSSADLYLNYGNVLAITTNYEKALQAFRHSYRLDNSDPRALYFIALTYNKLGDTLNATKYYNQFKSLNK